MSIDTLGYKNMTIYKINLHIKEDNNTENVSEIKQFIFVGPQTDEKIFFKLAENGYKSLTSSEDKQLESKIYNYKKVFGELYKNSTYFIFNYIDELTNIKQLKLLIYYHLTRLNIYTKKEIHPHNQYIWIQSQHLSYETYQHMTMFLFKGGRNYHSNDIKIDTSIFLARLGYMLQMDESQIFKTLKAIESTFKLFNEPFILYRKIFHNNTFRTLLTNVNIDLSNNYHYISDNTDTKIYYYIFGNPLKIKKKSNTMFEKHLNDFNGKTSTIINHYGKILNNEINLLVKSDWETIFNKTMSDYYFNHPYVITDIDTELKFNKYDMNYNPVEISNIIKENFNNNKIEITTKKIFFKLNNNNTFAFTDLKYLFNRFKTNKLVPIIQYENKYDTINNNGNTKLYVPFVKNSSYNLIYKLINQKKQYLIDIKNYLLFIANIEDIAYIYVVLMPNLEFNVYINFLSYVKEPKIDAILNVINLIIKSIQSLYKTKSLNLIGKSSLLNTHLTHASNLSLIDGQIKINYNLQSNKLDHYFLYDNILARLKLLNKYFGFKQEPVKPNIDLIFKSINHFYGKTNKLRFISNVFRGRKNITQKEKENIARSMEYLFFSSKEDNLKLINNTNISELQSGGIIGSSINLTVQEDVIEMIIEDINNFKVVNKIIQLVNFVIYDIINEKLNKKPSNIVEIQNIKNKKYASITYDDIPYKSMSLGSYSGDDFEDDLDFGDDLDGIDIDYDYDDIVELEENIKDADINKNEKIINIDVIKKYGKIKKLKYSNYMKHMRDEADKELFDYDEKYVTSCGNDVMRQPFILSDSEIKAIKNPEALTGYIKYRGNNYICPRIWDIKAKQPVSVKDYIENKGHSPYTNGKAVPSEKRKIQILNDEYTMIIRKPTTSEFWANTVKEKGWPNELKGTGQDGYPGLSVIDKKTDLLRPCCFKNIPPGFKQSSTEIQELKKFKGSDLLKKKNVDKEKNKTKNRKSEELFCETQKYIVDENASIDNCRLGLLPKKLDLMLNNHQDIFLISDKSYLVEGSNCFLRKGVKVDTVIGSSNFLNCIASIKNINNINTFKENLVKNIDPILFMSLNNGNLVRVFSSNDLLPSLDDLQHFITFLNENTSLIFLFNINQNELEGIRNLLKKLINLNNDVEKTNADAKFIKKIIILYEIYTSYHNYVKSILDNNEKGYEEYLDLASRPNSFLFPNGVNIIIFNKETDKLICNPYVRNTNQFIILIQDSYNKFTPVFHIINKNSELHTYGVIKLTKYITLSDKDKEVFVKQGKNADILNDIDNRKDRFLFLLKLHNKHCFINAGYLNTNEKIMDFIASNKLKIKSQIVINSYELYYLLLNNNILIPIYPTNFMIHYPVRLLSEIKLYKDNLASLWKYYTKLHNGNPTYNYKPEKIIISTVKNGVQNKKLAIGILFKNKLTVPIEPMEIPKELDDIETIYKTIYTDMSLLDVKETIQVSQLLYQDYIYQNFKYDFSLNLNEKSNFVDKRKFVDLISGYINIIGGHSIINSDILNDIASFIYDFMSRYMPKKLLKDKDIKIDKNVNIMPGVSLTSCQKMDKKKCNSSPFCLLDSDKSCKLNFDEEKLKLFSYLFAQDIMNSYDEISAILNGNNVKRLLISSRLLYDPNNIIINEEDIDIEVKHIKRAKIRKNIPINDFKNIFDITKIVTDNDINYMYGKIRQENEQDLNVLVKNIVDLTIDYIIPSNVIIGTPFDKEGVLNKKMMAGPCLFPYLDSSTYKLKYRCEYNKKNLLTCPVKLNVDKKPISWAYCPENPMITKKRMNVLDKITATGSKNKKYIDGECKFPYLMGNKLIYECHKEVDNDGLEYSWCPVKYKRGDDITNPVPLATDKREHIYSEKWKHNFMYVPKTKNIHPDFLKTRKKGYCQAPLDIKQKLTKKEKTLKFDDYNPIIACNTPSKGGYTKTELYNFGVNILKIPNVMLRNKDIIFSKDIICPIINNKYYEILELRLSDDDKGYTKDINKCEKGDNKGGYSIIKLRFIANKFYNMDLEQLNKMNKTQICGVLRRKIKGDVKEELDNKYTKDYEDDLANFDITKCYKAPNRGGYKSNKIKEIAKFLKIDKKYLNNKLKLCEMIQKFINTQFNLAKGKSTKKKTKKINTMKLQKLKSFRDL